MNEKPSKWKVFTAGIIRHTAQFVRQFLTHEFIERLSENIGLPDTFPSLRAFSDILYQVLRLLFCTNDRSDLRFDSRPDHMNGRTF